MHQLSFLELCPAEVFLDKPKGYHRGPVPYHPEWRVNLFILSAGFPPIALQLAWYLAFPGELSVVGKADLAFDGLHR